MTIHEFVRVVSVHQPSWIEILGTLATVSAVIVALGREKITRLFFKPNFSSFEIKISPQTVGTNEVTMYRLSLENNGGARGEDVRAFVVSNNNTDKKRFIPIPLRWTHVGRKRNIAVGERAYLDLFQKTPNDDYEWCWPDGNPTEPTLTTITKTGQSGITIDFADEYSLLGSINLKFNPVIEQLSII